jgi:hypothetical protein
LGSSDYGQTKNSLKHQTRNSRWFSEDFHSYLEGKATMIEHQLFLWPPMWIDELSPFCCTKIPSLRGDLVRHKGCRPKSLNLCLGSRMGSCWLRKKSSLSDSHENEAQGKRNLEVKGAAEGYLTPEEPNESRITKKRSFNSSYLNNPLQEFSRGQSFTFRPKTTASGFEDSIIRSFKSRGLEVKSRVHLASLKLAL